MNLKLITLLALIFLASGCIDEGDPAIGSVTYSSASLEGADLNADVNLPFNYFMAGSEEITQDDLNPYALTADIPAVTVDSNWMTSWAVFDANMNNYFLKLNTSNNPLTGNLQISKSNPTITLTDSTDGNSAVLSRTDVNGEFLFTNVVNQQASSNLAITNDGSASIYYELDYAVSAATQASASISFQPATVTGDQYIFGPQATGTRNFAVLRTGNKIRFALGTGASFTWTGTGSTVLSIGEWYHVLVAYNGNTPEAHLYLNGVEETLTESGTIPANIVAVPATNGMNIGTGFNGTGKWNGVIDELIFWDGAFLSANDAIDLFNSGSGLYAAPFTVLPTDSTLIETNLWGLWHFDEASGNTSYDFSGNYYHAIQPSGQTNYSRVTGKVLLSAGDNTVEIFSSQDAVTAGHAGISYIGANESETRLLGRTINFYPNGVPALTLTSSEGAVFNSGIQSGDFISIPLLKKLYLDGWLGDTYITTATVTSLDSTDYYVGGTNFLKMQRIAGTWLLDIKQDVAIPSLKKLFFDGLGNGDTYITEASVNDLRAYAGNYLMWQALGTTGNLRFWRPVEHLDNFFAYFGSGLDAFLGYYVSQNPDALVLGLGADSLGLIITGKDSYAFNYAHPQQNNPTVFIQSKNQVTNEWGSISHDGNSFDFNSSKGLIQFPNQVIKMSNAATPADTPANAIQLWADNNSGTSELWVKDESGNTTVLSPHKFELYSPALSQEFPFSYYSKNKFIGKEINVDMYQAIKEIENLSGKKLIYTKDIPKINWNSVQNENEKAFENPENYFKVEEIEILKKDAIESYPETIKVFDSNILVYDFNTATGTVYLKNEEKFKEEPTGNVFYKLKEGIKFDETNGKFYKQVKIYETPAVYAPTAKPAWIEARD